MGEKKKKRRRGQAKELHICQLRYTKFKQQQYYFSGMQHVTKICIISFSWMGKLRHHMGSVKGLLLCGTNHTLARQKHQVVNVEKFWLRAMGQYCAQLQ